jgi:hypothetical protein
MKIKFLSTVLLVALVGVAMAGEPMVANPEYDNWASFEKDASVKVKSVTEMSGMTNETVMTTTMTEKTDDKIVLELVVTMTVQGQEMEMPPTARDVLKEIPESQLDPEMPEGMTMTELDSGTEEVTVEAGTFECDWVKTKTEVEASGMTTETTVWTCKDVPGQMVKMESHMEMAQGMTSDTTSELIEVTE